MAQPTQTDPQFKLRLPAELKGRISAAAVENNRSMNSEMVTALERVFPPPDKDLEEVIQELNNLQIELRSEPDSDEVESLADEIDNIAISLMKLEKRLK